jgi:hypothetical protein
MKHERVGDQGRYFVDGVAGQIRAVAALTRPRVFPEAAAGLRLAVDPVADRELRWRFLNSLRSRGGANRDRGAPDETGEDYARESPAVSNTTH